MADGAAARMPLWRAALFAFLAMCCQDIMATAMVIFESKMNGPMAGIFDVAGWLAGLPCSFLAIESILKDGWRSARSLMVIAAVSAANFAGTIAGVAITSALTHHH